MSSEDNRVKSLVLDAGPIIDSHNSLKNLAQSFYAPQDVMNELKDEKTLRGLEMLPFEIVIREPSHESLKLAAEAAKGTGDFRSLSVADLKVIALTIDLEKEAGLFRRDVEMAQSATTTAPAAQEEKTPTEVGLSSSTKIQNLPDGFCPDKVDSDDDEGWITNDNVDDANGMNVELDDRPQVGCLTTDFAVQNVLLYMHLHLVSLTGRRIARIQSYIQRCRACYQTCPDKERQFCPKCGNKSLHKCAVSVDESGKQVVHVNWRRAAVTRGMRYSEAAPTGGKHHLPTKHFEDQPMPHLRPARARRTKAWEEPFEQHDTTSRSATLGVRTMHNDTKRTGNVNARAPPGKRRGGKR